MKMLNANFVGIENSPVKAPGAHSRLHIRQILNILINRYSQRVLAR